MLRVYDRLELTLKRLVEFKGATLGQLLFNDWPSLVTVELPWRGNEREVSCIPTGDYECECFIHEKFGWVVWVKDVPGRDGILFHAGNTVRDVRGCIAPGRWFGWTDEYPGVRRSKEAMLVLQQAASGKQVNLKVRD